MTTSVTGSLGQIPCAIRSNQDVEAEINKSVAMKVWWWIVQPGHKTSPIKHLLLASLYGLPDSSPTTPSMSTLIFNHSKESSQLATESTDRAPISTTKSTSLVCLRLPTPFHETQHRKHVCTSYRTPKNWTPIQVSRTAGCQLPELPLHRHHGLCIQKNLISFFNAHPSSTCDLFDNVCRHHHSPPIRLSLSPSSRMLGLYLFIHRIR